LTEKKKKLNVSMIRLLNLFKTIKRPELEARILLLGLDNSGKSCILKKLSEEELFHICPTQGFNIKALIHGDFKIQVWDIGGFLLITWL
jgi:ADP-ribosylation factor-like protein 3